MRESFPARLARVFRLDDEVYADVSADAPATGPALLVVLGAALLDGLGRSGDGGLEALLLGVAIGCVRWGVWVAALHGVARGLGFRSDLASLFRALGFAAAPFALGAGELLPGIGGLFWLAKWGLVLGGFVIATRRTLEIETSTASGLVAGGFAAAWIVTRIFL